MASEKHLALLKKAENAIGWKQYKQAIKAYDEAIKLKSNCIEAWDGKGKVYVELKEWDQAIVAFDKVIKLNPDGLEGYLSKAGMLEEAGRLAEAEAVYRNGINSHANPNAMTFLLGTFLTRQKRNEEAIEYLDQVIDQNSEPMMLMARVVTLQNLERYEDALVDANRMMAFGDFFMVYHTKGILLEKLGRDEEALETYTSGFRADPNPLLMINSVAMMEKLGRVEDAQQMYEVEQIYGESIGQPSRGLDFRAQVCQQLQRYDEAIAFHEQVFAMDEKNAEPLYEQAVCYAWKQDEAAALAKLKVAFALDSEFRDFAADEPAFEPIRDKILML
jgi:tetratricopeptide (TPR) repeat protein